MHGLEVAPGSHWHMTCFILCFPNCVSWTTGGSWPNFWIRKLQGSPWCMCKAANEAGSTSHFPAASCGSYIALKLLGCGNPTNMGLWPTGGLWPIVLKHWTRRFLDPFPSHKDIILSYIKHNCMNSWNLAFEIQQSCKQMWYLIYTQLHVAEMSEYSWAAPFKIFHFDRYCFLSAL